MEVKIESKQTNIFEGNNNQAFYTESGMLSWDNFKSELEDIMQKCNDAEKHELIQAMDALKKKKDESKFKAALKQVVKIGSDIFSNVSAAMLVEYMRTNGIL